MQTRTTRVRIELANPKRLLLPNMYADVEIATGNNEPVIAVPDSAVIDTGTRQVVILDRGEGRFEPREVKVGLRGDGMVEIRDGVAEGDRVRSEEHTSELQSLMRISYAGFCLKKKKI